jgi:hypothetical protein
VSRGTDRAAWQARSPPPRRLVSTQSQTPGESLAPLALAPGFTPRTAARAPRRGAFAAGSHVPDRSGRARERRSRLISICWHHGDLLSLFENTSGQVWSWTLGSKWRDDRGAWIKLLRNVARIGDSAAHLLLSGDDRSERDAGHTSATGGPFKPVHGRNAGSLLPARNPAWISRNAHPRETLTATLPSAKTRRRGAPFH